MFCHAGSKAIYVSTDVESNLLLIFPLYNLIQCNFLGSHSTQYRSFRLQKRIIRIMMGSRSKNSCRKLFTSLEILPLLLSIFFPFSDLLEKIRNFSPQIMRLTIMVLDNILIFITLRLI